MYKIEANLQIIAKDASISERKKRGAAECILQGQPRGSIYKPFKSYNPTLALRIVWVAKGALADLQDKLSVLLMKGRINTIPYNPGDVLRKSVSREAGHFNTFYTLES